MTTIRKLKRFGRQAYRAGQVTATHVDRFGRPTVKHMQRSPFGRTVASAWTQDARRAGKWAGGSRAMPKTKKRANKTGYGLFGGQY